MIVPSIQDLTKDRFNRYTLVIATAKSARMITDEYMKQREIAEETNLSQSEVSKRLVELAQIVKEHF